MDYLAIRWESTDGPRKIDLVRGHDRYFFARDIMLTERKKYPCTRYFSLTKKYRTV